MTQDAFAMLRAASRLSARSRAFSSLKITMPGTPRTLDAIVKLDMFAAEEPSRIGKIWETHHNDQPDAAGACCDAAEHDLLVERGRESPLFIFPLRRDGGHLMLLSQFDPKHAMWVMCYLEDYKRNPELAPPWLSAQLFPDLLATKGVALLRVEAVPEHIRPGEAAHAALLLRRYYGTDQYDRVWTFNHAERHFNLDAYLATCP